MEREARMRGHVFGLFDTAHHTLDRFLRLDVQLHAGKSHGQRESETNHENKEK